MPYTPQTWHDLPAVDTPVNAARLGVLESAAAAGVAASDTNTTAIAALPGTYARTGAQAAETTAFPILSVQPFTAGSEPFQFQVNSAPNSGAGAGTYNRGAWLGFNASRHSGGPGTVAGKPTVYMGFEDNYYDVATDLSYGVEMYQGYLTPDGTTIGVGDLRPLYWRVAASDTNTAAKSVLINMDIGSGASGAWGLWGSVKSGKQIVAFNQTNAVINVPLAAFGNQHQFTAATGNVNMLIKANAAGGTTTLTFQPNGGGATFFFTADQFGEMYLYDNTNGRILCNWIKGVNSDNSAMDVSAVLKLNNTQVATATAGAAAALPATPQGYFQIKDSAGTLRKVPYYV